MAERAEAQLKITDVADQTQLLSYAATAQVAYLGAGLLPGVAPITQNKIGAGLARLRQGGQAPVKPDPHENGRSARDRASATGISRSLRKPSIQFLQRLDARILTLAPP